MSKLVFIVGVSFALGLCSCARAPIAPPGPNIEALKSAAIKGSVPDAEELAKLKDKPAIEAMREVLQKCDSVQVKIAMIHGLGHNNKDLESVPLFLDIMEKDDKQSNLWAKAFEAVEMIGVAGMGYWPESSFIGRAECVAVMRAEYQRMKALGVGVSVGGRSRPNAKLCVRTGRHGREILLIIPINEGHGRMRLSNRFQQSETSYYLEVETGPVDSYWDWNDLVIRVDVQPENGTTLTALDGITSANTYELVDFKGNVLVSDFGPHSTHKTVKLPK